MENSPEIMSMQKLKTQYDGLDSYLFLRDGAARLNDHLPKIFSPESILHEPGQNKPEAVSVWEYIAKFYMKESRFYEALLILSGLYDHMVSSQISIGKRCHKGMPLIWMSDCYKNLGFPVLSKRYLMLTLIEDAITEKGVINPNTTGTYFRLVWGFGLPDSSLSYYATEIYKYSIQSPEETKYPEWILQDLDNSWMVEFPSPLEGAFYKIHPYYVNFLIYQLGESSGNILERLAEYLLACMPGCRTMRRQRSKSTDYDIICSMDGFDVDFRSEFGRYFVCECKDWNTPADFSSMAKFCRVLDSIKAKFGIIFSKQGISGEDKFENAEREQIKVFQDRGMVIIVVDLSDLKAVAVGEQFIQILRNKYEKVRLDLVNSCKGQGFPQ